MACTLFILVSLLLGLIGVFFGWRHERNYFAWIAEHDGSVWCNIDNIKTAGDDLVQEVTERLVEWMLAEGMIGPETPGLEELVAETEALVTKCIQRVLENDNAESAARHGAPYGEADRGAGSAPAPR